MKDGETAKTPSEVPSVPSEAGSRELDVSPEVVRAVANEFIGVYQHTPPALGISLGDLFAAIKHRPLYLLIGAVAGFELAMLVLAMTTALYAVSAQVVVTMQTPGQLVDTDSGSSAFIATQAEVIESPTVVEAAVASLPLPAHLGAEDDPVEDALDSIHASAISGTRVIALGYLGEDANYGAALLSAMVGAYVNEVRDSTVTGQEKFHSSKDTELDELYREIALHQERLKELRLDSGIMGSADEAAAAQAAQLSEHVQALSEARNRRIELESRLAAGGATVNREDPARAALKEELRQARSELAIASVMLTAEHPTVVGAKRNVQALTAQLNSSVSASKNNLQQEINTAVRLEAELALLGAELRERSKEIELIRLEENKLVAELDQMQAQADEWRGELFDQRVVSRLAETGDVGIGARMIAEPVVPDTAVWPKRKFMLAAGTALGLAVGFIFSLVSLRRQRKPDVVPL